MDIWPIVIPSNGCPEKDKFGYCQHPTILREGGPLICNRPNCPMDIRKIKEAE